MPGSPPAEVEFTNAEEWKVQAWREAQMLKACDGNVEVALELVVAGVDYHLIEKARARGCPVERLLAVFG